MHIWYISKETPGRAAQRYVKSKIDALLNKIWSALKAWKSRRRGRQNKEPFRKFSKYVDVPGLCKVAALSEIEMQGWSLNPGRYAGVAEREADDFDSLLRMLKDRLRNK